MVEVQVPVLLCVSVTESVTVCVPTSAHVYATLAGEKVSVPPQLSVEPLLIWEEVTVPLPEASRVTVTSLHTATGGVASCTVTKEVHEAVLLPASVTVSVTVLGPILEQAKLVVEAANVRLGQLSVEPLFSWAPVMVAVPDPLS